MSGNGSVLKKSGCGEKKGIAPCWRLLGYAALLVVNLISPPVLASSFTGLGESSRGGFAIEASAFTGLGEPSRGGFAIEASAISTDLSKVTRTHEADICRVAGRA